MSEVATVEVEAVEDARKRVRGAEAAVERCIRGIESIRERHAALRTKLAESYRTDAKVDESELAGLSTKWEVAEEALGIAEAELAEARIALQTTEGAAADEREQRRRKELGKQLGAVDRAAKRLAQMTAQAATLLPLRDRPELARLIVNVVGADLREAYRKDDVAPDAVLNFNSIRAMARRELPQSGEVARWFDAIPTRGGNNK